MFFSKCLLFLIQVINLTPRLLHSSLGGGRISGNGGAVDENETKAAGGR